MNYQQVASSNIAAVAYDAEKQILGVQFHRSGIYHYEGVPADVHESLLNADSVGKYFIANIKNAYPYTKKT